MARDSAVVMATVAGSETVAGSATGPAGVGAGEAASKVLVSRRQELNSFDLHL